MSSLKNYLLDLNLFGPPHDSNEREDEEQRRLNIIITRIYLFVFALILIIVGIVSCLNVQTTIITLEQPSKDQFELLPVDVQCPCSQISLSYGEFTSIEASFHQVCSSDFVSDRWIKAINSELNSTYFYIYDFRTYGSAQFQALAGFCRLSNINIQQSIASFDISTLISPQVLSESILQLQTQAAINRFQLSAPNIFGSQLQLVRSTTLTNQLISGLQTNCIIEYLITSNQNSILISHLKYKRVNGSSCTCWTDLDCEEVFSKIFNSFGASTQTDSSNIISLFTIPGISAGCLPVNSILFSTLECLYNQTCLDKLISYFPTTEKFTAMTPVEQSHFNPESTVKSMIDRLMVEDWMTNISYEKYYGQCAPISCTYSKVERNSLKIVLTKLISLLSGLTLVLGFVIPIVIRFIRRPRNPDRTSLCVRVRQLQARLKKMVVELNIFKHYPSNDRQVRYQRYATRVFIVLIVVSVELLTNYTLLSKSILRKTLPYPTESQYIQLEELYPDSLSCPVNSISMSYSTFITIQPHYHQLCSSDFVSPQWITYTFSPPSGFSNKLEYRTNAASQFELLAMFCQQAQQTIDNALQAFLQTQFVGSQVMPQELFESEVNSLIQDWKSNTLNQFVRTIQLIRSITQGNQLSTGYSNVFYYLNIAARKTIMKPLTYSDCSCALSQSCRTTMGIYSIDSSYTYTKLYSIPNFFMGCYLVEALFASTLECFYNLACMLEINQYMSNGQSFDFSALDPSLNWPNETIESIVDRLMVDAWLSNVSFTSYYNKSALMSCSFEYERANDFFSVLTTIISIFGGLALCFKILTLIILRSIEKLMNGFSRAILMESIKNLFSFHNEHQMINRLHFLLVAATLYVVYVFSAFSSQSKSVEINKPSLSIYQDLATRFPESLQCPCSQVSINYGSFLTIIPSFHQVCSSDFVSDQWIAYLYGDGTLVDRFDPTDFQYSASGQFQSLAALCELTQEHVNDSLSQLNTSNFINIDLLSSNLFDQRIQTIINQFQMTMPDLFLSTLSLIRETTAANMLMSTLSTSWMIIAPPVVNNQWTAHTVPLVYQGCYCGSSSKCVQSSSGMLAGCYPLETILQSTLQCLYDQQCIDPTHTFIAMNFSSDLTRFDIDVTIESIVNELMVEEFSSEMSYEKYFAQCAPSSCTYSYIDTSNIIEGITTLIGFYGGLVIICRLIAVIIVKLFRCRTQRTTPTSN